MSESGSDSDAPFLSPGQGTPFRAGLAEVPRAQEPAEAQAAPRPPVPKPLFNSHGDDDEDYEEEEEEEHDRPPQAPTSPTAIECWICRDPQSTEENPIMGRVCGCTGSVGHVHRHCIERWIATRNASHCPSCNKAYLWSTACQRDVPYPKTFKARTRLLVSQLLVPLLLKRLCVLFSLWMEEWLLVPLLLGLVMYARADWYEAGSFSVGGLFNMWVAGLVAAMCDHSLRLGWLRFRAFFHRRHTNLRARPIRPLPPDELDLVYERLALERRQQQEQQQQRQQEEQQGASAAQAGHPAAAPPVLRFDCAYFRLVNGAIDGFLGPAPEADHHLHDEDDDVSTEGDWEDEVEDVDEWEDIGEEEAEWRDPDAAGAPRAAAAAHHALPRRRRARREAAAEEADEEDEEGDGEDDDEHHGVRRANVLVPGNAIASLFTAVDAVLDGKLHGHRCHRECARRALYAAPVMLLLRTPVGVLLGVAALIACAIYIRRTFPRRTVLNPRQRLDEVVAGALSSPDAVTEADKALWYVGFASQMLLFSFCMPILAGLVARYATAPFLASAPESLAALLATLTAPRLVLYWGIGTFGAVVLMQMESKLMVPLFGPGVDLFFIRAVDLDTSVERYYYDLILAQIYDTDPLGIMWDFVRIVSVELLALAIFLAMPVYVVFGLREVVFGDVSRGDYGPFPMPLFALQEPGPPSPAAEDRYDVWMRSWLHQTNPWGLGNASITCVAPFSDIPGVGGRADENKTSAVSFVVSVDGRPHSFASDPYVFFALVAALEQDESAYRMYTEIRRSHLRRTPTTWPIAVWGGIKEALTSYRLVGRAGAHTSLSFAAAALYADVSWPYSLSAGGAVRPADPATSESTVTVLFDPSAGPPPAVPASWTCGPGAASRLPRGACRHCLNTTSPPRSYTGSLATTIVAAGSLVRGAWYRRWFYDFAAYYHQAIFSLPTVIDAFGVQLLLTAVICFLTFPVQRQQLRVMRPVAVWLARLLDLEWFLFDEARLANLDRFLGNRHMVAPEPAARLPPQRLILRRMRFFPPDVFPSDFAARLVAFSVLFLLAGVALFWALPLFVYFSLLSIVRVPTVLALGASLTLSFFVWRPMTALTALLMSLAAWIGAALYIAQVAAESHVVFFPVGLVDAIWCHAAGARRVLIQYPEDHAW